ncbi:Beta-barrel assembly machine subunit BamD [Formivibrio citricus]|uniref:Outer membrane protein assembly factor BamD n=1 Tax=Formivibrio citricus TaxID=83765 RepID=A0A1I5ATZ1_9NEIS|nr:outer membrane protein assembly factor BamD [Formivibrio citricus]SFN65669.1 Beta-barrel assembly machine subunit BamD [Formivibrio citricus]
MNQILTRILAVACAGILIAGCSSTPDDNDLAKGWSADKIYSEAKSEQSSNNFDRSTKLFEKLEARFPYGRYAQQAQLEIAYNHYKDKEPALALAAIDRFVKQYPTHPNMDYAYYFKGLVSFNEVQGFMSKVSQQDMSERDPKSARESFDAFRELVNRYPDSKYVQDARLRMNYLIGAIASHELHVARYYYKRGAFLAAANRAKLLIEQYGNTRQVEGALGLMVLSYDKLGMKDLRDDAKRVLQKNYPDSKAMQENFLSDPWWWSPL